MTCFFHVLLLIHTFASKLKWFITLFFFLIPTLLYVCIYHVWSFFTLTYNIEDPAIPFAVSLTSNPIALLDRLGIRIFQKAKLAHLLRILFFSPPSSFCSSASHSLVLLRSSLSVVIVFFLSLRLTLKFLSAVRTPLSLVALAPWYFSSLLRRYFREKSGVMPHVVACLLPSTFSIFAGTRR